MKLPEEGLLLRIFIGESDKYKGKPLYQQIVHKAKELDLAGATVYRGMMGFGHDSRIQTATMLRLSQDLPLTIEIVDSEEYIDRLLPHLDEMMGQGLVTMEKVRILHYGESQRIPKR